MMITLEHFCVTSSKHVTTRRFLLWSSKSFRETHLRCYSNWNIDKFIPMSKRSRMSRERFAKEVWNPFKPLLKPSTQLRILVHFQTCPLLGLHCEVTIVVTCFFFVHISRISHRTIPSGIAQALRRKLDGAEKLIKTSLRFLAMCTDDFKSRYLDQFNSAYGEVLSLIQKRGDVLKNRWN